MARADSTIRVNIVGDAKGLSKELKKADKGIGGLSTTMKGLVGAAALAGVGAAVVDFAGTALAESDRLGDATKRLELQLGDLASQLVEGADKFTHLGQSEQDILELEAAFADVATALGIADPLIADLADDAAATAAAVSLLTGEDPSTVIANIGKAADGSERAMKNLGINIDEAAVAQQALLDTGKPSVEMLTEEEIKSARLKVVMAQLAPKIDAVSGANAGLEEKTAAVQAKFETLTAKIGEGIEGPLNDLLTWILSGIEGWELFAQWVDITSDSLALALEPAAELADGIRGIADAAGDALGPLGDLIGKAIELISLTNPLLAPIRAITGNNVPSSSGGSLNLPGGGGKQNVNIIVQPNAHDDVEREVVNALRDHNRRNGHL